MTPLRIDVSTRWEAFDLMRRIARYRPWCMQMGPAHWIVSGRVDGDTDDAFAAVRQWAAGRELEHVRGSLGDEPFVLQVRQATG